MATFAALLEEAVGPVHSVKVSAQQSNVSACLRHHTKRPTRDAALAPSSADAPPHAVPPVLVAARRGTRVGDQAVTRDDVVRAARDAARAARWPFDAGELMAKTFALKNRQNGVAEVVPGTLEGRAAAWMSSGFGFLPKETSASDYAYVEEDLKGRGVEE